MALKPIGLEIQTDVSGQENVKDLARQLDQLSDSLEGGLKVQAKEAANALRELGAKQGAIDNFSRIKQEASEAGKRLREAQDAAQSLGRAMAASGAPTKAQATQMQKLREEVRAAKNELEAKRRSLENSRSVLASYGISTKNLAESERQTRQAMAQARAEVAKLAPAYSAAGAAAVSSGRQQVQSAEAVRASLSGIGETLNSIRNIAMLAVGGTFLTSMAKDVGEVADQYANLRARIALVTGDGPALEAAFDAVRQIALDTNSALESTADLFTRVFRAGKDVGLSQQQALELTKTINQAIQVSGGSAQAADAAITQLIQGLQGGVLRGEEFNSVMEQAPRLAQALADGLGVTTGRLREMAKEGRLTSEVVLKALQGQAQAVAEEFAKLPPTIGRALTNLSTAWTVYIGEVDRGSAASLAAASAINTVAENLDEIVQMATRAGAVMAAAIGVQAVSALRAYIAQAAAAGTATNLLALQMSKLPKTVQIAVAFTGFELGYQIGGWLRENSELARQMGIEIVAFAQKQLNSLQFLKEAAQAVFTDDTIEAALQRYNQRAMEQAKIISDMQVDAKKAPEAVDQASKKAAASLKKVGDAAADVSKKIRITAEDITEAYEASAAAKLGDAQAAEANLRVQMQLAQNAERMALFMGNEFEARKAKIQQMEIEIRLVEARANVAKVEAEGAIAVAQAKLAEMKASGDVNLVKQAELENSIKLAQAKIAEADATSKSTELMRKQLEQFRNGTTSAQGYGRQLDDLALKQGRLAGATRAATQAMQEQAAVANSRYSSPLGPDKYARPEGGSAYGNTREERLAGQNAVDNTTMFMLRDKLQAGLLTAADLPALQAVLAANAENDKIARAMGPGAWILEGRADWTQWQATMALFQQQVNRLGGAGGYGVGTTDTRKRVDMRIRTDRGDYEFDTDERGEKEIQRMLIDELQRGKKRSTRR